MKVRECHLLWRVRRLTSWISLQLLGTAALPRQRQGLPDVGVLASIRHPVMVLPLDSLGSGCCAASLWLPRQGALLLSVSSQAMLILFSPSARRLLRHSPHARDVLLLRRGCLLSRLRRPPQLACRPIRPLDSDVLRRVLLGCDYLPPIHLRSLLCHARHGSEPLAGSGGMEAHLVRCRGVRNGRNRRMAIRCTARRAAHSRAAVRARNGREGPERANGTLGVEAREEPGHCAHTRRNDRCESSLRCQWSCRR